MIAAILDTNHIVEVLTTHEDGTAFVQNMGRENMGTHWVGGEGHKPTKCMNVYKDRIMCAAVLADDDAQYASWAAAMDKTDMFADEHRDQVFHAHFVEEVRKEELANHIRKLAKS